MDWWIDGLMGMGVQSSEFWVRSWGKKTVAYRNIWSTLVLEQGRIAAMAGRAWERRSPDLLLRDALAVGSMERWGEMPGDVA